MERRLVFQATDVEGFSPAGAEETYVSRLLADERSVGSSRLVLNHFTLKAGKSTEPGQHPEPNDEIYYVLHGHGMVRLGDPPRAFPLDPDTVVFIPGGTLHSLENNRAEDLDILTIMPGPIAQGVNAVYDERLRAWGTSLRWAEKEDKRMKPQMNAD